MMADDALKVAQKAENKASEALKLADDAFTVAVADGALAAALLRTFSVDRQKTIVLAAINMLETSLADPHSEKTGVEGAIKLLRERNSTILV
jgi:hypothetical protein